MKKDAKLLAEAYTKVLKEELEGFELSKEQLANFIAKDKEIQELKKKIKTEVLSPDLIHAATEVYYHSTYHRELLQGLDKQQLNEAARRIFAAEEFAS